MTPREVVLDADGMQVLAPGFQRYELCAKGCGYRIGCGDAWDTVWHESCEEREQALLCVNKEPFPAWAVEKNVLCVVAPCCGFTFSAKHTDWASGGYSCPLCDA